MQPTTLEELNRLERPANLCDIVREVRETWDNRITFPPAEIPERYMRGDLSILIELSFEFRGKRSACSVQIFSKLVGERTGEINMWNRAEQGQLSVFVLDVEVMHDPERIVNRVQSTFDSLIWLKFLDELSCSKILNTLYLSVVSRRFVFVQWPHLKNGEFVAPSVFPDPEFLNSEFPDNMIQAGAEMVDNLPYENAEAERNLERLVVLNSLQQLLIAEIWENVDTAYSFLQFGFRVTRG